MIYHSYQKEWKLISLLSFYVLCLQCTRLNYVAHILALKHALNHGLKLTKVHKIIQLDQEAWLKPYIDMNTELRKEA